MTEKTTMQELLKHFIDAWSSPSDTFNPAMVIEKVESMLPKERQNLIDAHEKGQQVEEQHTIPERRIKKSTQYVNEKYGI